MEDAEGLARVRVETWQSAYRGIVPQEHLSNLDIHVETDRWRNRLANPYSETCLFAAEASEPGQPGRVAGFCAAGPNRDPDPEYPAEIYAIYVLPRYQGLGIGQKLVRAAVEFLVSRGYSKMVIYVLRDNHPSRKFYEALGGYLAREKGVEIAGLSFPEVGYGYNLSIFPQAVD